MESTLLAIIALLSAIFAGCSAWVAVRSFNHARDSFQIAQRPYLVIETIQIEETPNILRPIAAEIVVKNSGQTPVLNMKFSGKLDVMPDSPEKSPRDFTEKNGQISIGSNSKKSLTIIGGRPLNKEELQRISNNELKIFVTGTICYKDIFRQSHETEFCAFYKPDAKFKPLFLFACNKLDNIS